MSGAPKVFQFKLVLLGDSAVGKSSLVLRFVRGQFFEYQESTIGGAMPKAFGQTEHGAGASRPIWAAGRLRGEGSGACLLAPPRSPSRPTACLRRPRCAVALTTRWACAARSCILDSDSGVERHDRQVRYDIPAPPRPERRAPVSPARRACVWLARPLHVGDSQPAPSSAVADRSPHPRCCT